MAKMQPVSMLVLFAEIIWRTGRNYRQEARTDADRLTRDLIPGWRLNVEPVICHKPGECGFTEEHVKEELKIRQAEWDRLKSNPALGYELKAFETLYTHNGKLITPKFEGDSCYSRAAQYPRAVSYYFKVKDNVFDKKIATADLKDLVPSDPVLHVPALIRSFASETERLEAMIQENGANREGHVAPSTEDNLRVAKVMFDNLYNESKMRLYFGATMAVKLYGICFLDAKFPELRLVERICQKPETPGKLAIKPVDFRKLQEFKQRYENLSKFRQKTGNGNVEPLTATEVENYFNAPKEDAVERGKGIVRAEWEAIKSNTSCKLLEDIASAHLDNNKDGIKVVNSFAAQLNLTMELCRAGREKDILDVLGNIDRCVNFLKVAAIKQQQFEEEQREEERKHKELCERATANGRSPEDQSKYEASELLANVKSSLIVTENIPHGGAKSAKRVK